MNNNRKRKTSEQPLKRTDNPNSYLNPSTSNSNVIYIASDTESEAEEYRLNREVSDLYHQIKLKKERIEQIRINRAVKKAKIETEQRIRRETNKWLPALNKVAEAQKIIQTNLSSDDDDEYSMDTLPSVSELFEAINPSGKLNDIE